MVQAGLSFQLLSYADARVCGCRRSRVVGDCGNRCSTGMECVKSLDVSIRYAEPEVALGVEC